MTAGTASPEDILQLLQERLAGSPADAARVRDYITAKDMEIRRLSLDFTTTFEVANQINSKGLDLRLIESYTLKTIRGQFGVLKVHLLRLDDLGGRRIVSAGARDDDNLGFFLESQCAQELARHPAPAFLSRLAPELREMDEVKRWVAAGFEVVAPLVRTDDELKGVLLLGPKLTKTSYNDRDFRFLELIAKMVAISIHNAQLYTKSIRDSLTHVFTRGHFDVQLEKEIDRLRRYLHARGGVKRSVSLIMLDVDHFKSFNDRYGHQIGDAVLVELATALRNNVRSMDLVARYGGEEFILICPETAKREACILAERLRQTVESGAVLTERFGALKFTASFGVAAFPDDAESARELILQTDMAMYRAKEEGRNRTLVAPDGRTVAAYIASQEPAA